jgi:hypothetical protein
MYPPVLACFAYFLLIAPLQVPKTFKKFLKNFSMLFLIFLLILDDFYLLILAGKYW